MKKENLIEQLNTAKTLSSQVDIDKVIALIEQITPEVKVGITQKLADKIADKIERTLDYNSSDLVNKDDITFNIAYGNTIEVEDASIDVSETMDHITACLEEFVIEEDEEESTEEAAI
jgi:hypothetical protein